MSQLEAVVAKIEEIGRYTNPDILILKWQVQIVASKTLYSFTKCTNQATNIKALILSDEILVLWITINSSDLWSAFVLIFVGIRYKNNCVNNFTEVFARMIAIIYFVAVFDFFKANCRGIFEYLLTADFKSRRLFDLGSTYFGTVKTNGQGILDLHCLVCLYVAFYIFQLYNGLQADSKYAACIVEFINFIIWYFIIPQDEAQVPRVNTLSIKLST